MVSAYAREPAPDRWAHRAAVRRRAKTEGPLGAYRAVFRNRGFALFWTGITVSMIGDAITKVALTWYVYQVTGSAVALGWLAFLFTAPVVVGGFAAGWLLDRFDRRRVLIVDSLAKAVVIGSVPLLHAFDALSLAHVYVVAGVYGFLMMIPLAGTPALLPALVGEPHLGTANALETMSYTLSGVVGPPLAGVVIAWIDAPTALAFDAASYLAFVALLTRVVPRPDEPVARRERRVGFHDAIVLLLGNKVLLTTTAMYMAINVGEGAMRVWLPLFTDRVQGGGATLYGILLGAIACGEAISSAVAGMITRPLPLGLLIGVAQTLGFLALAPLLLAGGHVVTLGSLLVYGFLTAPLTIWAQTLRMRIIPAEQGGRSFALLRTLMQSTNPLGGLAAGFAVPVAGLTAVIAATVAVGAIPGLLGLRVRALRAAR